MRMLLAHQKNNKHPKDTISNTTAAKGQDMLPNTPATQTPTNNYQRKIIIPKTQRPLVHHSSTPSAKKTTNERTSSLNKSQIAHKDLYHSSIGEHPTQGSRCQTSQAYSESKEEILPRSHLHKKKKKKKRIITRVAINTSGNNNNSNTHNHNNNDSTTYLLQQH